ncbi:MAG TPA: ATP-binding cassette domain-containing protein [Ligilactobacillus acidipiscis]|uniref:ATP-binding cassette domain-containing protein n=1 Tax=Ligilactobacillus acidipiscis TaxID=89059 RepID=A0A921F8S5_9LACO|nr:ATP-binding cassette domain-containing protein [Ligilactobacillus acidipiscis]
MLQVKKLDVFIGRKKIIQQVDFEVQAGEVIGLIGPNGAGKTTIMKTILGLTKFTGKIKVNGQTISENDHNALTKVGALIEHPAIYPFLTGFQNLRLYAKSEDNLNQVVTELEMTDYINNKSKDYSLGMKQKLGIAIALLNQPELVILDEPMNGLDVEATILVRKKIKKYADQGTSFLISSHVLSELQKVMTGAILLNHGEIVINRSMSEFKSLNQQEYQILTNDMEKTESLFTERQLSVKKSGIYLIIPRTEVYRAQELVYANDIKLMELAPKQVSFEQTIVKLLEQQRETIK